MRGRLVQAGQATYGSANVEVLRCQNCGTDYVRFPFRPLTVNGHVVTLCPWCREDSAPWKNGRGC